jgi:8-oxo-dGTP pyrophosphatase MutT (NUDIX family)
MKGGPWGFPKGKVNNQEAPLECAIREVYEETGYNFRPFANEHHHIDLGPGDGVGGFGIPSNLGCFLSVWLCGRCYILLAPPPYNFPDFSFCRSCFVFCACFGCDFGSETREMRRCDWCVVVVVAWSWFLWSWLLWSWLLCGQARFCERFGLGVGVVVGLGVVVGGRSWAVRCRVGCICVAPRANADQLLLIVSAGMAQPHARGVRQQTRSVIASPFHPHLALMSCVAPPKLAVEPYSVLHSADCADRPDHLAVYFGASLVLVFGDRDVGDGDNNFQTLYCGWSS